ncbi:MAG: TonB-dependent receptor [Longimicrobiales bacterium]|nr:TonB-dependent receptor [Longimicrobiales bacterium]
MTTMSMRRPFPVLLGMLAATLLAVPTALCAQADSTAVPDSTMAQDGLYDRPFIGSLSSTSVGGYVEGNTNYFVEEGVSEGFSMELRRFNVFLFSQVSQRIRFLSELEFEHGTEEIALETALVDFRIHPSFVLRGGVILPPIGYLNQNHDSPQWDFVERPLVTTDIIPSTLSEVGFGVYGKIPLQRLGLVLSYDAYLTNGLGEGVVGNDVGRTDIPSGKGASLFGEDNNGSPAVSGRLAARKVELGEVGISYYGGYYNSFRVEGEEVDERRWLGIAAVDVGASLGPAEVRAEVAYASIEVPAGMQELFGQNQWGGHIDVLLPVWRPRVLGYTDAVVTAGLRLERVDYNTGDFLSTGSAIGDDVTAVVPGLSFRPSPGTVFRANYRFHWITDLQGNEPVRRAGFQVGFATYF